MYFVYLLLCENNSIYTGIASDVEERIAKHRDGKGAKYTRSHKPVRVLYTEKYKSKGEAASREAQIKGWCREKKLALIGNKKGG
jgi:putative endonuclease